MRALPGRPLRSIPIRHSAATVRGETKRCRGSGRVREKVREGGIVCALKGDPPSCKSCRLSVHLFSAHSFRTEAMHEIG